MPHTLQESGLKVVFTRVRSGRAQQASISGALFLLMVCALVAAAAWAGAAWQHARDAQGGASNARLLSSWRAVPAAQASMDAAAENQLALNQALAEGTQPDSAHEADFVRENVGVLASRLGALQAQVVALDSLNRRLIELATQHDQPFKALPQATAASASATPGDAPILATDTQRLLTRAAETAGVRALDTASLLHTPSAEDIGRQLDALQVDLGKRSDLLATLDPALVQKSGAALRWPTATPVADFPYLSSSYGWRRHPITGRQAMHEGLDFAAPRGTPINAAAGGVVVEARYVNGYGNLVEIDHGDGLLTRYAHASRLYVKQGDVVKRGQRVAAVGSSGLSTGPHLHFEVKLAGQPLDPRLFLPSTVAGGAAFASARPGEG